MQEMGGMQKKKINLFQNHSLLSSDIGPLKKCGPSSLLWSAVNYVYIGKIK